jgi:hypothetical protein
VPVPSSPESRSSRDDGGSDDHDAAHDAAVTALRAAFARLQPQGSHAWNFLAAFTHLSDRYGQYQPFASDLSKLVASGQTVAGRAGPRQRRLRHTAVDRAANSGPPGTPSELEQAMAQVVEAFRFLSARVGILEERAALEDGPVAGAPWLLPAQELGRWVEPVAAHLVAAAPRGVVVHGDCGEGALLDALERAGVTAHGTEPRGTVALGALERGHSVSVCETADELSARPPASLGGMVLSGVVDRLPLHALVTLLAGARRTLTPGAPLVVVVRAPAVADGEPLGVLAGDLLAPRSLHARTWALLLERAGFVGGAPLVADPAIDDKRLVLSASVRR